MNLIDINRTFYPTTAEYAFFSNTHAIFSKTDPMSGHKTSSTNSRRLESYHESSLIYKRSMKLEMNKRKAGKFTNTWKLHNTLMDNQ